MNKIIRRILSAMGTAALFLSVLPQPAALADSAANGVREVKVAYPIQQNLSEMDENGNYFGYLTDYLNMIAEFAGWDISYVTYPDMSLSEQMVKALEDVKNGDADLLGGLLYNDAITENYLYPQNSCGAVYTTLETLETNYLLRDTNYNEKPILRVAILKKAVLRNQEVFAFADSMGISCEYIQCETIEEQLAALENGTADAMTNVSLTFLPGLKTLAGFAPRPYYYVTGHGNGELMKELDEAIEKIDRVSPYFQSNLQTQYFNTTLTNFDLSVSERAYIAEHNEINVLVCPNHAPFSFVNSDQELCGIAISIMNGIGKTAGVQINYHIMEKGQPTEEQMATGQYDVMIGPEQKSEYAISRQMVTSNKYLETNLTMFINKEAQDKPKSECVLAMSRDFSIPINQEYKEIKYYDDIKSCIEAVNHGDADFGYANRYTVDFYTSEKSYRSLNYIYVMTYPCIMSFYFPQHVNENLISLVNRYLRSMPSKDVQNYLTLALAQKNDGGIVAFVRNNPIAVAAICAVFFLLLVLLSVLLITGNTNKKRNEKLQQAYAAKSEFLSRMSHDMRTPMNGIIGLVGFLQERDDLSPEAAADIAAIDYSSKYLLSLINDTLDMSKIESAKLTLNPEVVNTEMLIRNIVMAVSPLAKEKEITLEVVPINAELEYIRADKVRIQQMFINVLSNSVKFTPRGGKIRMEIECLKRENGIAYDRISVEDNGIGMSEEFLPHIFETFAQESGQVSSNYSGTGLGMAIVKKLVELMGGTVEVESKLGVGTKVTAYLNFERVYDVDTAQEKGQPSAQSLEGKRILLCEDHPLNAQIATRLLEKQGVIVDYAENGKIGVEKFSQSAPYYYDAVLMDIRMPVMDGLAAAAAIRALGRADAVTAPIVAMTANAFDDDVEKSKAAGMNAHLAKPIDPQQLYQTLSDLIA